MCKFMKAGVLGGIVVFAWCAISWMVLPWHTSTMHNFTDTKAVVDVIQANITNSGVYFMPTMTKTETAAEATPVVEPIIFAAVRMEGQSSMVKPMVIGLITDIVAATLVAWLLMLASGLSYWGRVRFVTIFGLAAGIVGQVPNWNWLGFDAMFTLVQMADLVIGWYFAGLVLAWFCKKA